MPVVRSRLDNQELSRMSFIGGFVLIEFVFLLLFLASSSMALGLSIERYQGWLALSLSAATPFLLVRSVELRQRFSPSVFAVGFVGLVAVGALVSGHFYDVTYDGQAYHQEGIIQLAEGWNPYYQTLSQDVAGSIWVNHYSKGSWIVAACIYEMTGSIEHGKLANVLLILGSLFICLSLLLRVERLNVLLCVLFSLLLAFNPVSIYQSLGFYVDGQLSSVLISLMAVLVYQFFAQSVATRALTFFLIILLVNIKFTGVAYTLVVGFAFVLAAFFWNKAREMRKLFLGACAAFLIGTCAVGYNPYVTNILNNGHPFFPLFGQAHIDITSRLTPFNFIDMSRGERLFMSVFGKSGGDPKSSSELKPPFTFSKVELLAFSSPATLVGGWGPLFGGAVLLASLALVGMAWSSPGDVRRAAPHLAMILIVLSTALIHEQAWWARYAPQLWVIPVIVGVMLVQSTIRPANYVGFALTLILAVNCALVGASYAYFQNKWTNDLSAQLGSMDRERQVIPVDFGEMESNRIRLQEAGIAYRRAASNELRCDAKEHLVESVTAMCASGP